MHLLNFELNVTHDLFIIGEPLYLGESLSLSAGQQATLKCLSSSQDWGYTLRKILAMVFDDMELAQMCAVGKVGAKNTPMRKEDLGALKGIRS